MPITSIALAIAGIAAVATMGVATTAQVFNDAPKPAAKHSVHAPANPNGFNWLRPPAL